MSTTIREYFQEISKKYLTAKNESLANHPLASVIKHNIPLEIGKLSFLNNGMYVVAASAGMGRWTSVPWIAIMNNKVTSSTQSGYYLVYLFSDDMKRLYLSFSQGITNTSKEQIAIIKQEIRDLNSLRGIAKLDDDIFLGDGQRPKGYASATAAYIEYDLNNLPYNEKLIDDLRRMVDCYEQFIEIRNNQSKYKASDSSDVIHDKKDNKYITYSELVFHIHSYIKSKGFYYSKKEVINLYLSLKSKPFVILSGISGTGKTKMVQWFAESLGANEANGQLALIPVRPDWNDGSDLLGYVDIKGEFKPGPLTEVIKKARDDEDHPYFVLLDEMNLARVEHYFSDILSVMESRKWDGQRMVTSPLLKKEVTGYEEDLLLSSNVYVIGTVNMDETTHPFSKKVLDRANTIEFNRVELSNLSFLGELEEVDPLPINDRHLRSEYLHLKDVYKHNQELVETVTAELEQINQVLKISNAQVGYRVRDEICFYLAYNNKGELMDTDTAMDHCILQKILPRISGSDTRTQIVLEGLYRLFTNKEWVDDPGQVDIDYSYARYPKSAAKAAEMLRRLQDDGFTSFWIS